MDTLLQFDTEDKDKSFNVEDWDVELKTGKRFKISGILNIECNCLTFIKDQQRIAFFPFDSISSIIMEKAED